MNNVCVLLATFNGEQYLKSQLDSILAQHGCDIKIVVSDDLSTDSTMAILMAYKMHFKLSVLPKIPENFGSAYANFIRLIFEADIGDAEYIAFSDQDDIWVDDKINHACCEIQNYGLDAYSSNVEAFWDNGRKKGLIKSNPQKKYDFLFESAGPGSTYVLKRESFEALKEWLTSKRKSLDRFLVHDWLIYAYGRSQGWRWKINAHFGVLYRQHCKNELGANVGILQYKSRIRLIISGSYWENVKKLSNLIGIKNNTITFIESPTLHNYFRAIPELLENRRKLADCFFINIMLIILLFKHKSPD